QDVTLTSQTGDTFTGQLLEFDGNTYQIDTVIGVLNLPVELVECKGEACPVIEPPEPQASEATASAPGVSSDRGENDIVISGSSTVGVGLMPLLVSGYASHLEAQENRRSAASGSVFESELIGNEGFGDPIAKVVVRSSVTSDAFANLIGKSAQLGMASRRISRSEARSLADFGAGNMISPSNEHIVAVDSLVVIVHPSNLVRSISIEQLRSIFSGSITNWSQLGGTDAPITVVDLNDTSGSRAVFDNRVFPDGPRGTPENLRTASSSIQASNFVSEDPNAISYVSNAFLRGMEPMTIINECGLPMIPDTFSARTGEYGLQRFLYFYNRA
ncbi:MAG: substrate-binding domain-containing protein, partial [Pseudomonadota bacterium]